MSAIIKTLIDGAKTGNIPLMQQQLALGADLNAAYKRDTALVWAANEGKVEAAAWLIDHGADVNLPVQDGKYTPLTVAAVMGQMDVVILLLERGAHAAAINSEGKSVIELARQHAHNDIANYIQKFIDLGPDEVSFNYPLQDRVMQEIFNFPRKERVTLVRKAAAGDVEAMQRDSFSALDDLSGLRRAFAEHKTRGGEMDEAEVFSGSLQKPKLNAGFKP